MPSARTPLPDEIKELIVLIRQGRLFDVQAWIAQGRPLQLPREGRFVLTPLLAAIGTGFHSMVEVLLKELHQVEDLDQLLEVAVHMRRLDLVELLHQFGARPASLSYESVANRGTPPILKWFEAHGLDLVTDNPIATAFINKWRLALGTYMRSKDRVPELRRQADIALRYHASQGNLKWVCLLLWAGADPRAKVPRIDVDYLDDDTALRDAVSGGHLEIVRKFNPDPERDDVTGLLYEAGFRPNREMVDLLLALGADPTAKKEESIVHCYMWSLERALDEDFCWIRDYRPILEILCLFAKRGARWTLPEGESFRSIRTSLGKAKPDRAIEVLNKLMDAGLFELDVFKDLMSSPRMKELLQLGRPGVVKLRKLAGLSDIPRKRGKRAISIRRYGLSPS